MSNSRAKGLILSSNSRSVTVCSLFPWRILTKVLYGAFSTSNIRATWPANLIFLYLSTQRYKSCTSSLCSFSTRNSPHSQSAITLFCPEASNNRWGRPQSQAISWITSLWVRKIDLPATSASSSAPPEPAAQEHQEPSRRTSVLPTGDTSMALISADRPIRATSDV